MTAPKDPPESQEPQIFSRVTQYVDPPVSEDWLKILLGELVGKTLDHSQMRMLGEASMYKMFIEKTAKAITAHIAEEVRLAIDTLIDGLSDDFEIVKQELSEDVWRGYRFALNKAHELADTPKEGES